MRLFYTVLAGLWLASGNAEAKSPADGGSFIPLGAPASAPLGFTQMCERDTELCLAGATSIAAALSPPTESAPLVVMASAPPAFDREGAGYRRLRVTADDLSRFGKDNPVDRFGLVRLLVGDAAATATSPVATAPCPPAAGWTESLAPDVPCDQVSDAIPSQTRGLATAAFVTLVPQPLQPAAPAIALPPLDGEPAKPADAAFDGKAAFALIGKVNRNVNDAVVQVEDINSTGEEDRWNRLGYGWRPAGDCEDIAIEKRMRLMEMGFPADRLFLAVAYKYRAGLHTVLIARLPDGDYVLDSLVRKVRPWSKVTYQWLRVQTPGDPLVWRGLTPAPAAAPTVRIASSDSGEAAIPPQPAA